MRSFMEMRLRWSRLNLAVKLVRVGACAGEPKAMKPQPYVRLVERLSISSTRSSSPSARRAKRVSWTRSRSPNSPFWRTWR